MKKIFNYLAGTIVFVLAIYLAGGFLLPKTWHVIQKTTIKAQPEIIYEQIANLKNWQNWAPWNKDKDPSQEYSYEGPDMGAGAKWLWKSEKMGSGWLEITEASPDTGIVYKLFIDMNGRTSNIRGSISYTKVGAALDVIWTDQGEAGAGFNQRWLSIIIKIMLSKEMASGLEKLKYISE